MTTTFTRPPPAQLRALRPGDLGWVIGRHGTLYAQEHGFDQRFEALVAHIAASYVDRLDPARECAWVADQDDQPVGCVFVVQARDALTQAPDPGVAQLRLLLVEPQARGHGVGKLLTAQCESFARQAGYRRMRLWTNQSLTAARAIYRAAGYEMLASETHSDFGSLQVGEVWEKDLDAAP
jgi:GNAT superfamily N-acetyltransferase